MSARILTVDFRLYADWEEDGKTRIYVFETPIDGAPKKTRVELTEAEYRACVAAVEDHKTAGKLTFHQTFVALRRAATALEQVFPVWEEEIDRIKAAAKLARERSAVSEDVLAALLCEKHSAKAMRVLEMLGVW